jgi:hypothetical protein
MSTSFWDSPDGTSKFIDAHGKPLPSSAVFEHFTSRAGSWQDRSRIISPAVQAAARDYFDCPSLRGAELEDDLNSGSAGRHWEQRIFEGEIMDSVAGAPSFTGKHVLTNITLALLQDTGW